MAARVLATYPVSEHASLDDALIAAAAQSVHMTVVTRHFELLGVPFLDQWGQRPQR